jgi:glycosyltransferase involved in cell wall biosynthesis
MRILMLSGIWPPDVGGPATHGPDFARFLVERGHDVHVVTMADGEPAERPCPVETVSRARPFVVRYPLVAVKGARAARQADVVYATATYAAAAAASVAARRPLVVKLVSDPAYERAHRYGLFSGTVEEFQAAPGATLSALRRARTRALRRARAVVVPSAYLAEIARGWALDEERVSVLSNPAPDLPEIEPEAQKPHTFVFVGRLTAQKGLDTAVDALALVPEAQLLIVGEGPERGAVQRHAEEAGLDGRIRFTGALRREEALRLVAGAEAALLSSDWENLPHSAVEALAVGTPVVATAVGGVPEVVHDGENGLLVPPRRPVELAAAMRRVTGDPNLRARLAAGARPSIAHLARNDVYGRLESILQEAAR